MEGAGPGGAAATLRVDSDEQLLGAAERVEHMLEGAAADRGALGEADRATYRAAAARGEELFGVGVEVDDVVVVHDALSAIVIQPARERGAHAVWRIRVAGGPGSEPRRALEFLQRFTTGIDAYILSWQERGARGELIESVGAALPSAGMVAAKEFPARFTGDEPRRLAWRMALAEIVRSDRGERVGGTQRPRPAVAPR